MSRETTPRRVPAALLPALLALVAPAPAGIADAPPTVTEPVYLPAGVSDAEGAVACIRTPAEGVEIVDVATGRTLWRSAPPARPLLMASGQAFVLEQRQGRAWRVTAYAERAGDVLRTYDLGPLELPEWASLSGARAGREWTEFDASARLAGAALQLRYDARRLRVTGMAPGGPVAEARGLARIDLDSGRVEKDPGPAPPEPALSEPAPALPDAARRVDAHARRPDTTIVMGGPPPQAVGSLIAGDTRLAFALSADARVVSVFRWPAGARPKASPLRIDHGLPTDAVWVTLDRRHVLLRRAMDQEWHDLYALDGGRKLASLRRPLDVAVLGSRIFWTTADRGGSVILVAGKPESARPLWRRTVRKAEAAHESEPPIP